MIKKIKKIIINDVIFYTCKGLQWIADRIENEKAKKLIYIGLHYIILGGYQLVKDINCDS